MGTARAAGQQSASSRLPWLEALSCQDGPAELLSQEGPPVKTLFLHQLGAIPPTAESTYSQDLVAAIAAAMALVAILSVVLAVIWATFVIIRIFTETLRVAVNVTAVIITAVIIIGLLNR